MIQALQAPSSATSTTLPVSTVQASRPTAPVATTPAVSTLGSDNLQIQSRNFDEAEARAALTALQAKYGQLYKPGFFSNSKIDLNEALSRIKDGKDVMVKNKDAGNISDKFDSYSELLLLDDLQGRKQDHGVSKPELRLPLLFLEKQKLEAYNSNDDRDQRLDAYNAYDDLKRDWRIVINGKAVKPKDLANYVIAQGWTADKDPGFQFRSAFTRLPEAGWKINGQDVSREVAYLSWIAGDRNLQLDGVAVQNEKDFAILMQLVANENNQALDPDLRERLGNLNLSQFQSPVKNLYSVYKHLEAGQALRYAGSTLNNLNEAIIYDALAGSRKPTGLLDSKVQSALHYLTQGAGLSASNGFVAWQELQAGKSVSYSFNGGPTHEPIRFQASSLNELVQLHSKVVAQRQRDTLRPELGEAKGIMADRLPGLESSLQENLERTRRAVERAKADIPVQEQKRSEAQADYARIKPVYDRALAVYQEAERSFRAVERNYQADQRNYEWELSKYQRIERELRSAQHNYESALRQARNFEDQARREDGLVSSDPQNADAHRQKAAQYRSQAQNAQSQASRYQNEASRLRMDLDRQRWDLQRAEREMERSRREFYDARNNMDSKKHIYEQEQARLNDATQRERDAENMLRMAQQTVAEGDAVERVSADASRQLSQLKSGVAGLKNYADYASKRQSLHQAAGRLQELLADPTYTRVHGNSLRQRFAPLQTLLNNMDKPEK